MSESSCSSKNNSSSDFSAILINIILPVLILSYCSEGDADPLKISGAERFWHIGPWAALAVALGLPLGHGLYGLCKKTKFSLLSILGIVAVLSTGLVSIYVVGPQGQIHPHTPLLYGIKEGLIPLVIAACIWILKDKPGCLFRTLIYNDNLFDIRTIEQHLTSEQQQHHYRALLRQGVNFLIITMLCSSLLNVLLSWLILRPVMNLPLAEQQLAYNMALGKIMWIGFLVIGIPSLLCLLYVLRVLLRELSKLTGLERDKILKISA